MSSFEKRFYRQNPTLFERLRRNIELAFWLSGYLLAWFGPGRRLRRDYRAAQQRGEAIVLEDYLDDERE